MRHICALTAPANGPSSCVEAEDYDRYCADKGSTPQGERTCGAWRVPASEEHLPPRNINLIDPSLKRQVSGFHRYFSQEVIDALEKTCGNKVYIADKPPFASTDIRARSLRNTVLQALDAERADKVILIGVSQGVQDARYMAARLPADDAAPSGQKMSDKVAAIVSLAGEDGGAESASLALNTLFVLNQGHWSDRSKIPAWTEEIFDSISWSREENGNKRYLMSERCRGVAECNPTIDHKYRWTIRSYFDLSTRYMRPNALERWWPESLGWASLRSYLGVSEQQWQDLIPHQAEANNGITYFNYAAEIGQWHKGWGTALSMDSISYWVIRLLSGANDGYVSVARQRFSNTASNFIEMPVLRGTPESRGYHHMFFTGRNPSLYTPPAGTQQTAPYDGGVAQVYQQIARDLKKAGF